MAYRPAMDRPTAMRGGDQRGGGQAGEQGEGGGHGEFAPVGQNVGVGVVADAGGVVVGRGGIGVREQAEGGGAGDDQRHRPAQRWGSWPGVYPDDGVSGGMGGAAGGGQAGFGEYGGRQRGVFL